MTFILLAATTNTMDRGIYLTIVLFTDRYKGVKVNCV